MAEPAVGFALVLLAATSLYLDLNTRFYLLRPLFFRRASQNVVSPGSNPDAPARLLLVAHYDAGRTGTVFEPKQVARAKRLAGFLHFPHTRLLFWSVALLLPILGARMAGVDSDVVSLAQLPPTLILLFAIFLLVDIQLSDVVPGANDNASGVAVALALAERLREEQPRNLDVWLVLTGAQECGCEGMRSFLRGRRKQFDRASTFVLAIDSVGSGDVRWVASEGLTVSFEMDRRLLELCDGGRRGRPRGRAHLRSRAPSPRIRHRRPRRPGRRLARDLASPVSSPAPCCRPTTTRRTTCPRPSTRRRSTVPRGSRWIWSAPSTATSSARSSAGTPP